MVYKDYQEVPARQLDLLNLVYLWMAFGLLITGIVSYASAFIPLLSGYREAHSFAVVIASFILQIILVIALSAFIDRLSYGIAILFFIMYAALMGITASMIIKLYTPGSITTTFFITAGMFASMAVYGRFTHTDLSRVGTMLGMALWGLILGLIINIFLASSLFDTFLSLVAVVIFAGLTAADVQRIKVLSYQMLSEGQTTKQVALACALKLYLDFVNLFLSLLRLTGRRRS